MEIIDISFSIHYNHPRWPGSAPFQSEFNTQMPTFDNRSSFITIDSHFSTHIDAPSHFVESGKNIDQIDLEKCIGDVHVFEIRNCKKITADILETVNIPSDCERIIFKTDNQNLWKENLNFSKNFVSLDPTAAQWLVEQQIKLVGIDYLSVQGFYDGPEVHQILLNSEVVIVESLKLDNVSSGKYYLVTLPIKLKGLEASPTRAILINKYQNE